MFYHIYHIYVFNDFIEAGGPIYAYQQTACSGFNTRTPAEDIAIAWQIRGILRLEIQGICDPESHCNVSAEA